MRRSDTLSPPTREMAILPPTTSVFWSMAPGRRATYLRAVDEGRADAEAWLRCTPRQEWVPTATLEGAGSGRLLAVFGFARAMAILEVAAPWDRRDGLSPSLDATDALTWYDRAFRGRVDEALDDEEPTR